MKKLRAIFLALGLAASFLIPNQYPVCIELKEDDVKAELIEYIFKEHDGIAAYGADFLLEG